MKRTPSAERRRHLRALQASGESLAAYSRRVGVSTSSLYRWRNEQHDEPVFIELSAPAHFEVALELRNGRVLRFEVEGGALSALVEALNPS